MSKKSQKSSVGGPAGPGGALPRVPTVSIGGSAGGLVALQALFEVLPHDLGVAFVVIMHLKPDEPSELAGILSRRTAMPVHMVTEKAKLEPNNVYVIPPNAELVISDGNVEVRPFAQPRGHRSPIDRFFRSMSEHGDGIAVVLSGGGSDGSVGLKAVKEGGGVILVQEPNDAEFGSMPRSAIATGLADVVLPVRELAGRIAELARDKLQMRDDDGAETENAVGAVLGYLRARTGHDFSRYKRSTVLRRLTRRMQLNRTPELAEYLSFLRENVEEVAALFSDLLISVTTFFRDADAFEALSRTVMPVLMESHDEPIRVWVPGCATGEEAYTLAMILLEAAASAGRRPEFQIFATDLDSGVLATAREGRYPSAIEADVNEERLEAFFVRDGDHYRIKKEVRDLVLFAHHSLLKDPPFSKLDLVSCRNLMIYLERDLQAQVCAAFHYALKPGKYLFLGSAETADGMPGQFQTIDREHRIYQAMERAGAQTVPRLLLSPRSAFLPVARPPARAQALSESAIHLKALEELSPPSAVVDEDHSIVHLSETAGRFLQPSGGTLGTTVTQMARPELRLDLRAGLHRAFEKGEASLSLPIIVNFGGANHRVLLQISTVARATNGRRLALVVFLDGGPLVEGVGPPLQNGAGDVLNQLQQELMATRERLKISREEYESTNEELRAANEELQSINEEYRSTSEELETSKEELQSMNEELQTLNAELKIKLEGVSRAHSDLQNLMAATEVGTLFLDTRLRIKRFTPRVAELFSITPSDEGRPITDFTHQLKYDQLETDTREVLRDLAPVDREAESRDGRWYLMRIRPYRTVDDKIDGVVASFVDVTERRITEQKLRHLTAELDHRVKNILTRVAIVIERSQANAQTAEQLAATLTLRIQSMADTHALLSRSQWAGVELQHLLATELGPYRQGDNVLITGPKLMLNPAATQGLSMVIHELTTNATKHGALTRVGGRISIETKVVDETLMLSWTEFDGPPISTPNKRGFGLSVIEELLQYELGATIEMHFRPSGLTVSFIVPMSRVKATL